jgi:hypothetical protein
MIRIDTQITLPEKRHVNEHDENYETFQQNSDDLQALEVKRRTCRPSPKEPNNGETKIDSCDRDD